MQSRNQSKFYQEDIVRRKKAGHELAVVLRCWHDSDDYPPLNPVDPLLRPLAPGEITVSFFPTHWRDIVPESEFDLVDRNFQIGDVCKKDIQSVESGVIIASEVQAKVEHAITHVSLDEWIGSEELEPANDIFIGDFVVLDDWIGQIEEIFDEAVVQLNSGNLVRVPQLGGRLQIGDSGPDVLPPESPSFIAALIRPARSNMQDVVLSVRPTAIAVSWMAINQTIDPSVAATRSRPPRFFAGPEMSRLLLVRGQSDGKPRVGDKYIIRNSYLALQKGLRPSFHGKDGVDGGVVVVRAVVVTETRTRVTVLWQSGAKEEYDSNSLIPYLNVDEYDCWPGDYVLHKTEDAKRVAVVQQVNAEDRTAMICYHDNDATELVSLLELDPHGTSGLDTAAQENQVDSFGVRRGDFVFIHRVGTKNGAELPRVPKIGEVEPWVREIPTMEDKEDGSTTVSGWRGELHNIGQGIAKIRGTPEALGRELDGRVQKVGKVDWFGEVIELRTDGLVEVILCDGEKVVLPLERLTRLQDGMDNAMADMWGEGFSDGYGQYIVEDSEFEVQGDGTSQGTWEGNEDENAEGGETDEGKDEMGNGELEWDDLIEVDNVIVDEDWSSAVADVSLNTLHHQNTMSELARDDPAHADTGWGSETEVEANAVMEVDHPPQAISNTSIPSIPQQEQERLPKLIPLSPTQSDDTQSQQPHLHTYSQSQPQFQSQSQQQSQSQSGGSQSPSQVDIAAKKAKDLSLEDEDESQWQRFAVLPGTPVDHAFYSSKPAQTTKAFISRLNKEYRVLKSSLPDSILVRAYEDRADLLRSLIIGPENTPYENAPFVIDWLLDSDFPQTPPQAHFLSWTNGNGRVNPNLYEEGKVCLSILGTWAGDRNESWSAARSSLLQAFVSIQGLVLVREPWFCEPAYEKLRNTEEGMVNSRLYNEKAYVLSRGFVRRALEVPLGSLETEIKWFYYDRGRLFDVIQEARELIQKSRQQQPQQPESNDISDSRSTSVTSVTLADRAVPRLTAGGMLMLSRTLQRLEAIWEDRTCVSQSTM